ncbi:antibiotic biosynthesis monooxygenase [Mesorhizobium sp. BR1-1-16]|uniref:antibiotic biosynthesis monooxygenase family protein n=1 Tax=Mesorhizobium sp. BR1-1-16 TaxID=2876653 RepID=UPI001CC932DA|nr:antibiotic biosynthesis monooxygenase [Mesorhizobium sp. BR1-1-16]MBZ9936450.1 antibiotic biosynthesis monooxygenase [Mesorhizobium sp. BR1-1-16]
MSELSPSPVYRIASLAVPEAARDAFVERAAIVKRLVQQQPGLIAQHAYEQQSGPGRFNYVTIATWADQTALDAADLAIAAAAAADGVDRAAFTAAHGIVAEIGTFGPAVI